MTKHIIDIKNAIYRNYGHPPFGKKIFEIAHVGNFSGPILSKEVVMLISKDQKTIHITHSKLLVDYREPLVLITAKGNRLDLSLFQQAQVFPQIMQLWKEVLCCNDDED